MRLRAIVVSCVLAAGVLTASPAAAEPPSVVWSENSVATVFPAPDGYVDTIRFTWTTSPTPITQTLEVRNSNQATVFSVALDPAATTYTWNGRTMAGTLAPAGAYVPVILADNQVDPVAPASGWQFQVSAKKLVARTFTTKVTASGSIKDRFVGACSTLRKPGKKLGAGSLGYYSNTKCRRTTNAATVASIHGITLPAAFRAGSVRIDTYGAAVSRGSFAVLVPLTKTAAAVDSAISKVGSAKGWYTGKAASAAQMQDASRRIRWGAVVFGGDRYDIKYFKVVYRYTVLV